MIPTPWLDFAIQLTQFTVPVVIVTLARTRAGGQCRGAGGVGDAARGRGAWVVSTEGAMTILIVTAVLLAYALILYALLGLCRAASWADRRLEAERPRSWTQARIDERHKR